LIFFVVSFQLPLILAWALSIHKAQGSSLDWVKVDLKGVFASGQTYVALSRARWSGGLEVRSFSPSRVMVDSQVVEWHRRTFQRQQGPLDSYFASNDPAAGDVVYSTF